MQRSFGITMARVLACLGGLFAVASAQSTNELPSAPSSVIQEKKAPSAPPPAPQATPAPSESTPSKAEPDEQAKPANTDADADAKEKTEAASRGQTTIPVRVNEVNVVFTVTDKHNHYVKDLGK